MTLHWFASLVVGLLCVIVRFVCAACCEVLCVFPLCDPLPTVDCRREGGIVVVPTISDGVWL